MNDLYLIGNGFDLAHGLKTSYSDFLLWYLNGFLKRFWQKDHYEDELMKIDRRGVKYHFPEKFDTISSILQFLKDYKYERKAHHDFFEKIILNYHDCKWVDIEYEYYMALVDIYKRFEKTGLLRDKNTDKELDILNKCFDSIKEKLKEYLTEVAGVLTKEPLNNIKNILWDISDENQKLVLYFNYTSTIKAYFSIHLLKNDDLIYIHGKLDDPKNPIIFGYGDEIDPYYEKIENLNNNEFLKNIKSFGYFKTTNYQDTIRFIESGDFTVKILGHSCGLSDRILLNTIFEHPNCKAIKIYYYQKSETENDYFEKTQEISRHFKASGKGNMRTKIIPFPESVPLMPFDENN